MKTVALGKVAKIVRAVASNDECLSLPYVGLEHVEKERGHFADDYVPTPLNMLATNFRFTPKHVLYGKLRPYLNKVVLPNFDGVCTTEILPILPNEEKLDRTFLWAILLSPTFVNWATSQISGANLPRLDPKLLAEYEIPLPPLTEQKWIASLLARADRLRALRRTAHELGESLLQSVFLEMFGDPLLNDKNWQRVEIENLIHDLRGGSPLEPEDFVESGFPVLHKGAIKPWGEIELDPKKKTFTHDAFVKKYNRAVVNRDYVAVTLRDLVPSGPSIGLVSKLAKSPYPEYILAQGAYAFLVDKKRLNADYLMVLSNMPSFRKFLRALAVGSTQIHIRNPIYTEIAIPLPPLSLQEEFAGVVARVESLRGRMGESARQVEGLFESLLAEAFAQ